MNRVKGIASVVLSLVFSSVISANQAGVDIGVPLSLNGEQKSGFSFGAAYAIPVNPKTHVELGLSYLNVQETDSTGGYLIGSVLGRYEFATLGNGWDFDAILGLESSGYSDTGLALGAGARYAFSGGAEVHTRLIYNTNEDLFLKVLVFNPFNLQGGASGQPVLKSDETVAQKKVSVVADSTEISRDISAKTSSTEPVLVEIRYKDIAGHWAKPSIEWAASRGLYSPADRFVPGATLNRFSAESVVKKSTLYCTGKADTSETTRFGVLVTKRDLTVEVLKVVLQSRGVVTPAETDIVLLAAELDVPKGWLEVSDQSITRAESAVVVAKILQAASFK